VDPEAIAEGLLGQETAGFRTGRQGILHVVTVPMAFRTQAPEVVGTLSLGLALDTSLAHELRGVTESEVAFAANGRVLASSLPGDVAEALQPALSARTGADVTVGGNEYVALARPLAGDPQGPLFVVLRSRTERLRFLEPLRTALFAAAAAAVLGAVLLSFMISRTVTLPLAEITTAMREIARTGDFTRKLPPGRTYYDEDARVLGSAFNTLLDSVVRFQREAADKERLSALGRLSTVIAHEVRNPLMIIKASLRGLRRGGGKPAEVEEAAVDIDHEVARLNRIVGDVLDFARPLRLDVQPTDVNAVCRDAAAASSAGAVSESGAAGGSGGQPADSSLTSETSPRVRLNLAFADGPLLTDPERLRTALVNVLGNAREAVSERPGVSSTEPASRTEVEADIELSTHPAPSGGVAIVVHDRGVGITPADLPHVFDPYFTTKRSGTGLGLAIARNIVEALHGTITVTSAPGQGTEIRIELPARGPSGVNGSQG
jgi:two-component system, NtrC family, sensor histidine kinase HydH